MTGRHNPREKGRSASAQEGARYAHHTNATTPHTTLACIAEKRNLPTQTHFLRRRNHNTGGKHVAGRHNPREKGMSASAQDGAGMCTTAMPQLLTQPSRALPNNAICTTKLTCCDEGRMTRDGNTWRGDITHERKVGKCTRWGRYVHHTNARAPHTTLACIAEQRHLHNQTHMLRRRKNDTGWKHVAGRHNPREKGRQVHKMGQVCAPHQCQSSSHNPRMHCRKTPFAQPNSRAATKEPITREGNPPRGDITQKRKEGQQVHKMG